MAPVALAACALESWTHVLGDWHRGLLPAAVALLSLAGLWLSRHEESPTPERWHGAVLCGAVTLALGIELGNEWLTMAWAAEALVLLALWRRLDRPAIKYAALAHLVAVTLRLVVNPNVLGYHERASTPVFNWIALTYGVPALALFAAWALLRDLEAPRLRPWRPATRRRRSRWRRLRVQPLAGWWSSPG